MFQNFWSLFKRRQQSIIKGIFLFLAILFIFSCKKSSEEVGNAKIVSHKISNDKLFVQLNNGKTDTVHLKSPAAQALVSPDSQKIAIDIQWMSDLQITEVYSLKNSKKGAEEVKNLSSQVWDNMEKKHNIDKETVIRPRTHALKWDEKSENLVIEATAEDEMGNQIKEEFSMKIE